MSDGSALAGWTPRPRPQREAVSGHFVRLEPLDPQRHARTQYEAHREGDADGALWTNLGYGPFASLQDYEAHLRRLATSEDPLFFAAVDHGSGEAVGTLSLMRMSPEHGTIEVGHICHTPRLQGTPGSTEAIRLLGGLVFDTLGYRRFEWKCDAQNALSRRAADRLGFRYEGTFRQHMVVKGRNRDTAWFAMLDGEWPQRRAVLDRWLAPDNFDPSGRQRSPLARSIA